MKIVFPEFNRPNIQAAIHATSDQITALPAPDLASACMMVRDGQADALIAGIDYPSREVILACKEHFGMGLISAEFASALKQEHYSTFSGLAVMQRQQASGDGLAVMQRQKATDDGLASTTETFLLADMAACKRPTKEQLLEIVVQTATSARQILSAEPRIALLSFSTHGSGGHDASIENAQFVLGALRDSGLTIDGELQLDAAINPDIAAKKAPASPLQGQANVLIAPDLCSGNILYKAFEQIGGFRVAGPILQGFQFPVSDLSRGSTTADVIATIESLAKLAH